MQRKQEIGLLSLGVVLTVVAHLRWPSHAVAWVAPIPWLLVLRARLTAESRKEGPTGALRFRLLLVGLSILTWTAATYKIVTPPIPGVMAVGFGVPFGLVHVLPLLLWDRWMARRREGLAVLSFGAASAVTDWALGALTPLGVWNAAANTQVDNLPFLQLVSVTGLVGPAFLMAVTAAAFEIAFSRRAEARAFIGAAACAALVLAVHAWGAVRLASPIEGPFVRVAAVGTDATFGGLPLPSDEELGRIEDGLFTRTAEAARAGAKLVVWTEGATAAMPEREPALRDRLKSAARDNGIDLVAAFIVPVSIAPLRYENKYLWISPTGDIAHEYWKHEPVPGEPAVKGKGPLPVVETGFGRAGGAICYDYDFPGLALEHARKGVDLVALPSSDWAGIDPLHTQMAAIRAIEGGFSIVRSTRFGLSAGIDARGRLRGWQSANEAGDRVLLIHLPARRTPTIYGVLGDLTVAPFAAFAALALAGLARRKAGREAQQS